MVAQHVGNNMREISQEQITWVYLDMLFLDDLILVFAITVDMSHSLPTQIIIWRQSATGIFNILNNNVLTDTIQKQNQKEFNSV